MTRTEELKLNLNTEHEDIKELRPSAETNMFMFNYICI